MKDFLVFLLILSSPQFICSMHNPNAITGCYKDWSRCTPITDIATGILWRTCADRCSDCLGRESGECVKADDLGPCSGGWQCQCTGGAVEKSNNWFVKLTCAAGL